MSRGRACGKNADYGVMAVLGKVACFFFCFSLSRRIAAISLVPSFRIRGKFEASSIVFVYNRIGQQKKP